MKKNWRTVLVVMLVLVGLPFLGTQQASADGNRDIGISVRSTKSVGARHNQRVAYSVRVTNYGPAPVTFRVGTVVTDSLDQVKISCTTGVAMDESWCSFSEVPAGRSVIVTDAYVVVGDPGETAGASICAWAEGDDTNPANDCAWVSTAIR